MMLRYIVAPLLLACALAAPSPLDLDHEWTVFKDYHNKEYTPEEEALRRVIWESNLQMIQKHNLEADRGLHTYRLGINHLADLTREEAVKMLNGYKMDINKIAAGATYLPPSNVGDLPPEVDWRKKGYVTPVKTQGKCGSCWAFSATGSLEGQHFKKTGKLVSLSEQNLVDCGNSTGNRGCDGGLMDAAFFYIQKNHGIDTEVSYPYTGKQDVCNFRVADVGATDVGFTDVSVESESALETAVATVGPVSAAIDASHKSFLFYKSGVYYERNCSAGLLDHGVLVVGYGTTEGNDYWLVKNSWGVDWGMKGYIMMSRHRDNNCGIATASSYPRL